MDDMNIKDSEHISDLIPEFLAGTLNRVDAAGVRGHLQTCAECRGELDLARVIAGARLPVPAQLEARVLAATRERTVAAQPRLRYALAASIAVAVIGGSAILPSFLGKAVQPTAPAGVVSAEPVTGGWMGVEDAFNSGASSLRDLSVEELQKLLHEMGS
jgi:predicted anti-sigma-YlaC factor YlaD